LPGLVLGAVELTLDSGKSETSVGISDEQTIDMATMVSKAPL
jgi:hypothetical protein